MGWLVATVKYKCLLHGYLKVGCDWTRAIFGPQGQVLAVNADGVTVLNTRLGRQEAIPKITKTTLNFC